jgi:hypothetical protein
LASSAIAETGRTVASAKEDTIVNFANVVFISILLTCREAVAPLSPLPVLRRVGERRVRSSLVPFQAGHGGAASAEFCVFAEIKAEICPAARQLELFREAPVMMGDKCPAFLRLKPPDSPTA